MLVIPKRRPRITDVSQQVYENSWEDIEEKMIFEINYALDKTTDGATHSRIPAIQGEAEEEPTEKESLTVCIASVSTKLRETDGEEVVRQGEGWQGPEVPRSRRTAQ